MWRPTNAELVDVRQGPSLSKRSRWSWSARRVQVCPTSHCAATPSATSAWSAAFLQGLRERGWIEGRNIQIEYRFAEGRSGPLAEIASEFVRLKVDVIVTHSTAPVVAAKRVTADIPIVFANAGDPVGNGLVASLARPGGNVTGLSIQGTDTVGKRLELLREAVPSLRRLAVVGNVDNPAVVTEMREVQAAARTLGLEAAISEIRRAEDIGPSLPGAHTPDRRRLRRRRRTRDRSQGPHQYSGTGRKVTDDVECSRLRRSGSSDVLWGELPGPVATRRLVCRQDTAPGARPFHSITSSARARREGALAGIGGCHRHTAGEGDGRGRASKEADDRVACGRHYGMSSTRLKRPSFNKALSPRSNIFLTMLELREKGLFATVLGIENAQDLNRPIWLSRHDRCRVSG